jgi:hypothetical protein
MHELISRIPGPDLPVVVLICVLVVAVITVGLVSLGVATWQRHHERELAASIVAGMLDRGFSPEEVVRVLEAAGMNRPWNANTGLDLLQKLKGRLRSTSAAAK